MSKDLTAIGRRFNTTTALEECAYCGPLMEKFAPALEKQGIKKRHLEQLNALEAQAPVCQQAANDALALQKKATDRVAALLDAGVTALGTTANLAEEALGRTNPEALERLPGRSSARDGGVASMVDMLGQYASFVKSNQAAFVAIDEADQAAQLEARALELSHANQAQEKAKQAAAAAEAAIATTRGEIYELCGKVYRAGRVAFRKQAEIAGLFRYQAMVRNSSSGSSASGGGAGGTDSAASGEASGAGSSDAGEQAGAAG